MGWSRGDGEVFSAVEDPRAVVLLLGVLIAVDHDPVVVDQDRDAGAGGWMVLEGYALETPSPEPSRPCRSGRSTGDRSRERQRQPLESFREEGAPTAGKEDGGRGAWPNEPTATIRLPGLAAGFHLHFAIFRQFSERQTI